MKKILKNYQKNIYGIKYPLYAVIKNQNIDKYYYYISAPWDENIDVPICKCKNKSFILNKYTLSTIAIIYTIFIRLIICTILMGIYNYFDGCRNFIRNKMWVQNERYFNWCNIFIIIGIIIWLILK